MKTPCCFRLRGETRTKVVVGAAVTGSAENCHHFVVVRHTVPPRHQLVRADDKIQALTHNRPNENEMASAANRTGELDETKEEDCVTIALDESGGDVWTEVSTSTSLASLYARDGTWV